MENPGWIHFKMPRPSEVDRGTECLPESAIAGEDTVIDPPLGGVLSLTSREAMRRMLSCASHNREAMEELLSALAAKAVTPRAAPDPATAMN